MEKEYYDAQIKYINEIRSIRHDIQAHMIVLQYYLESENYEKAKRLLKDMEKRYPKEYKVPMYLSFVIYRIEGEAASGDYREVERYYEKALKLCKNQGIDPDEEFNMIQMENIIRQLEEQGFL